MNKKVLLKEIRKHPDGSKMLSLGYSPSFIHSLLLEQEDQQKDQAAQQIANSPAGKEAGVDQQQAANAIEKATGEGGDKKEEVTAVTIFQTLITGSIINAAKPKVTEASEKIVSLAGPLGAIINGIGGTELITNVVMDQAISPIVQVLLDFVISDENKEKADDFINSILGEQEAIKLISSVKNDPQNAKKIITSYADQNKEQITTNVFTAAYKGNFGPTIQQKTQGLFGLTVADVIPQSLEDKLPDNQLVDSFLELKIGEMLSDLLLGEKATDQIQGKAPEKDPEKDIEDISKLVALTGDELENKANEPDVEGGLSDEEKEVIDDVVAQSQSDNEQDQVAGGKAIAAADGNPKLSSADPEAIRNNPGQAIDNIVSTAQGQPVEQDPFAEIEQKYGQQLKAFLSNEEYSLVKKVLGLLKQQKVINESSKVSDVFKAMGVDNKVLGKALMQLSKDNKLTQEEMANFKKIFEDEKKRNKFIQVFQAEKPSDDKTPEQEERIENNKKEALGGYTEAYKNFNERFMKETYLANQGKVFDGLYQIVLTLSDKQTEDIDRDALAFSDANVEGADLSESLLNEQDKEGILKLYQQGLIPQTNKMQRNTDKIMDILEEYQNYASGNKIKQGSRALFQKYGEMDPKKLLFKVVQMTMKDIATLEEMLDEYKATAPDSKEQEDTDIQDFEKEGEVIPEALIKEQKDVKQIIAEVKAVYFALIKPDTAGRALFTRARKTTTGEKRTDSPEELEGGKDKMEESILREVYRLLKEDEEATNPNTQKNIKELALQVYEEMVKIRGYFPNVSPFGTDYGMDKAIKGLTKTLEGFNDLVLSINNKAKDKRVLGDVSELELKLKAIKENLKKYFGVSEYQKKAAKAGAMNNQGQKAVEQGKAEPTEDAMAKLLAQPLKAMQGEVKGLDGLVKNIIDGNYDDNDVVNELALFFDSGDFMTKIKKGFNYIKSKLALKENEEGKEDESKIRETYYTYMKIVVVELLKLQSKKGQPGLKKDIKNALNKISSTKQYKDAIDALGNIETLKGFNPKSKFSMLSSILPAQLNMIIKSFTKMRSAFKGQSKFKGVFVVYNLAQLALLADSSDPEINLADNTQGQSQDKQEFEDVTNNIKGDGILALSEPERRIKIGEIFKNARDKATFNRRDNFTRDMLIDLIFRIFVNNEDPAPRGENPGKKLGPLEENIDNSKQYYSVEKMLGKIIGSGSREEFYATLVKELVDIQEQAKDKKEVEMMMRGGESLKQFYEDPMNATRFFKYYKDLSKYEKKDPSVLTKSTLPDEEEEKQVTTAELVEKFKKDYEKRNKAVADKLTKDLDSKVAKRITSLKKKYRKIVEKVVVDTYLPNIIQTLIDDYKNHLERLEGSLKIDPNTPEPSGSEDDKPEPGDPSEFFKILDSGEQIFMGYKGKDSELMEKFYNWYKNQDSVPPADEITNFGEDTPWTPIIEEFFTDDGATDINASVLRSYMTDKAFPKLNNEDPEKFKKLFSKTTGDKPETQGLDKYAEDDTEIEILNEFFKAMKELNENFIVNFLKASGNNRELNSKVAKAVGKVAKSFSQDQIEWLKTTLIKMVKEDRELFDQQAGIASAKPEQDSEKAKENQEDFVVNVIEKTYEEFDSVDYDNENFEENFADEVVKNAEPFFTQDEARQIDPDAIVGDRHVKSTFDQHSNETGNEFNSEEFLYNIGDGFYYKISSELASEEYLKNNDIPLDDQGDINWSEFNSEDWDDKRLSYDIPDADDESLNNSDVTQSEELKVGDVFMEKKSKNMFKITKFFGFGEEIPFLGQPVDGEGLPMFNRLESKKDFDERYEKVDDEIENFQEDPELEEQIERKLEIIIEHYLNTGRI